MKPSEILTREEPKSFTPGPWSVLNNHPKNACVYVTANDGKEIAVLYDGDKCKQDSDGIWSAQPIRDATAYLIAAAPELYEALKFIYEHIADPERQFRDLYPAFGLNSPTAIRMARDALAKATGEAK